MKPIFRLYLDNALPAFGDFAIGGGLQEKASTE